MTAREKEKEKAKEGRRKKEEGRRKKAEGRRKKEEGRRRNTYYVWYIFDAYIRCAWSIYIYI